MTWGSAVGGTVAWLGVVLSAALNYRRAIVPVLWWVLCLVVLVCFIALAGARPRTTVRDRVVFAILTLSAIGACAVWGADLMSGVLLMLVAGIAGWVVPPRVSIPLMVALTLALALLLWLQDATVVWALLYGSLLFFASLMVHVVVREQEAREEAATVAAELEAANVQLQATNSALREAQARLAEASKAEERLRISRDLHDGMGNQLTALSLQLDLLGRIVDGPAAEHVDQAKILAGELLRDIRGVVGQLRESRVSPRDRIARLARAMPRPRASLDVTEDLDRVSDTVAETVVRVVQESLTNAAKHSSADRAWVVVGRTPGGLSVEVRDNGPGRASITPGNGLSGMAERVALLGGELTWRSGPDIGFVIVATIPVPEDSDLVEASRPAADPVRLEGDSADAAYAQVGSMSAPAPAS